MLPQDKAKIVEELQKAGRTVCFIGDGINDILAMKQAQVSISFQAATEMARNTANIILIEESLKHIPQVFELARYYYSSMQANTVASIVPGTVTIFGVMFLRFGLLPSVILNAGGFMSGTLSSLLLAHKTDKAIASKNQIVS